MRLRNLKRRWRRQVVWLLLGLVLFLVPGMGILASHRIGFGPGKDAKEHRLTPPAEGLAMAALSLAEGGKVLLENDGILHVRDVEGMENDHEEKNLRNIIGSAEDSEVRPMGAINHNLELEGQFFNFEGGPSEVVSTPVPPSLLLLGSGLVGLHLLGRRRKKS